MYTSISILKFGKFCLQSLSKIIFVIFISQSLIYIIILTGEFFVFKNIIYFHFSTLIQNIRSVGINLCYRSE